MRLLATILCTLLVSMPAGAFYDGLWLVPNSAFKTLP